MESVGHINIYNVSSVDILPVDVLIICQGIGEDCPMAVTALHALIMEEVLYNIQVVVFEELVVRPPHIKAVIISIQKYAKVLITELIVVQIIEDFLPVSNPSNHKRPTILSLLEFMAKLEGRFHSI
jgi:hypothetical protein